MAIIISAEGLSKSYGKTQVLHELEMEIQTGESVAILGQSGSGKTTLLSLLAGLEKPDEGQVFFENQNLNEKNIDEMASLRGSAMGIIFQEFHLVSSLTAHENIALPLEIQKKFSRNQIQYRAQNLLERVGLKSRGHHYPQQLSGGEQQRVAIARALSAEPRLLFADEPTGNLDEGTAEAIETLIFSLIAEQGLTAILVTHNKELAARCNRTLTLHLGRFKIDPQ